MKNGQIAVVARVMLMNRKNEMNHDLVEIAYTYDNGTVRMLKGADAKQWQEWIDALCVLAENRNSNYPFEQLNWIEKTKG